MKNSSIRIATLVAVISAVWILSGFFGSSDKPKDSNPTAELKGDTDLRQRVRFRRISAEEWNQEKAFMQQEIVELQKIIQTIDTDTNND